MKNIFKKLQKFHSEVSAEIIKREDYFAGRSDNWQEDVKGDDYVADTECLIELNDALHDAIINLHPKV